MAEPLEAPPEGDVSRGPAILAIAIVSLVIAILCVLVRLYIRLFLTKHFGWDDGVLIIGVMFSIVGVTFNTLMVHNGGGRHLYYLSLQQRADVLKYNTLFALMNVGCAWFVKTSILIFIYRIQSSRAVRWMLHVLTFLVVVVGAGVFFFVAFQCVPLNALWNHSVKGVCVTRKTYGEVSIAQGVIYSTLDLGITAVPIVLLWNVQMRRRTKIGICLLMSLGLAATAFNIMRVVYHEKLGAADFTFDFFFVNYTAQLEQNICIVAAAVPTFPHLFKSIKSTIKSKGSNEATKGSGFALRSLSRVRKVKRGDAFGDFTDMSHITVQHEVEQRSTHGDDYATEGSVDHFHAACGSDGRQVRHESAV